jgi:ubiquinone/menaquinone biosynthesis C-methylase UbiE
MATTPESSRQENTYFIQDSGAELARVIELERVLTRGMGGLLPEHPDPSALVASFHRVLDVACGPGGWSLDLVQAYPHLQVEGFDIDQRMIDYANSQARVAGLDNARFRVMNAAGPLDYPTNYFDLVNARWLAVIPTDVYERAVRELVRITRPGGIIRLTENEQYSISNGPAFESLSGMFLQAVKRAGNTHSPDGRSTGLTPLLGRFLHNAGCQSIQMKPFVIDWSAGAAEHEPVYRVLSVFIQLLQPFLIKVGVTTKEEFERLYNEAEIEMHSDDFRALWYFLTVWGTKSNA